MTTIPLQATASRSTLLRSLSLAMAIAVGFFSATASAAENLQVKNDIVNLMLCYGKGTDTFGAPGNPNAYWDGLATYEECFTEDARFNLWPAGFNFNGPPALSIVGPTAWAQFVDAGVPRNDAGDSISHGQHMLSNFMVETQGTAGSLTAYLNATRTVFDPEQNGVVTNVSVANGTYTLHVEKIRGKWMVKELDLKLISFVDHFSAE